MPLSIDYGNEIIGITSPTTAVDGQVLHDFIEDNMASPEGLLYEDILQPEGKIEDPTNPGVYSQIILVINSPWQIQFWGGSGYTRVYGAKIVGGLNDEVIKATGTAGDITVLESPVDGLTVVSGSGVTEQDKIDIVDQVWDETLSEHVGAGSTGEKLDNTSEITTQEVEDSTWDALLQDHTTVGTFGNELATVADIDASASTEFTQASNGTIVNGVNNSGSYTDTTSRDSVYWEVGEDAVNGITVEFTFNLPSLESKAGVFNVFGRYTGSPPVNHHQELWAYNYESASWEQLADEFMPGGITADELHTHEYYERHVDRTNSNEVKIRIIHHTTTYNALHAAYFDYVDVSSIKVITAENIADAVWESDLTDFSNPGTFGFDFRTMLGLQQHNFRLRDQVYQQVNLGNNNFKWVLTSGTIRVYNNATDAGNDTNHFAEYTITATYDANGNCTAYTSVLV